MHFDHRVDSALSGNHQLVRPGASGRNRQESPADLLGRKRFDRDRRRNVVVQPNSDRRPDVTAGAEHNLVIQVD